MDLRQQPHHGALQGRRPRRHATPCNRAGSKTGQHHSRWAGLRAGVRRQLVGVGICVGLAFPGASLGCDAASKADAKPAESKSAGQAGAVPDGGDSIPVQTEDGRTMTMADYKKQGDQLSQAECVAGIEAARAFIPFEIQAEEDPETGKPKTSQVFCATAKLDRWTAETNKQWRCEGSASDLAAYLRCSDARRTEVLEYVRKYDATRYQAAKEMHRQLYVADLIEREAEDSETLAALTGALTEAGARGNAMAGIDHCVSGVLGGDKAVVGALREFIEKKDFKKLVKERKVENVATVCSAFFYAMALNAARDGAE